MTEEMREVFGKMLVEKEAGATVVVVANDDLEYSPEDRSRACADMTIHQAARWPFGGCRIVAVPEMCDDLLATGGGLAGSTGAAGW